jgi:hypothetical protein
VELSRIDVVVYKDDGLENFYTCTNQVYVD